MHHAWPAQVQNLVGGNEQPALGGDWFDKVRPTDGRPLCLAARSRKQDVEQAVAAAQVARADWADLPPVERGLRLHRLVRAMQDNHEAIARAVAADTGKSYRDAHGETAGAIALGLFYASEGQRLYGRTTTSGVRNRQAMTVRQPIGIAGLIVPANTPIANIAWKVFPALICGNTAVLKAAEDAPLTAWLFGRLATETGLPPGALNVVHGYGAEAGMPLAEHPDVGVISFTGSTATGRQIQQAALARFARVSLELGGKNPFVVCDDADLNEAARWAVLSAFSNAGQRCASGSRIIVVGSVYERFRNLLLDRTRALRVGFGDDDDLGPVINASTLERILAAIERARVSGAAILVGGHRLTDHAHRDGFYLAPTLLEGVTRDHEMSTTEIFGPVACLYRVESFREAISLANDSPYGLTACIHTGSLHRAMEFVRTVQAGVAVVNAGTYGSEPHMPFGGIKQSGNGAREPGSEAIDVYSYLKDVYINVDPARA